MKRFLAIGLLGITLPYVAPAAPPEHAPRALDLRAPPAPPAIFGARAGLALHGTPSTVQDNQLPVLGGTALRVPGKVELFARRLHREGLPLARLWEGHSALISIGLSPKGKPGLWLIQKIP